jgi:uncharacterized membrane protein
MTFDGSGLPSLGIPGRHRAGGRSCEGGAAHGFLRDRQGDITTVDVPGAVGTLVVDLNDRGQMVGIYLESGGKPHGFRRDRSGDLTTIDAPGATLLAKVGGINNRGQIAAGRVDAQLKNDSFLFDRGRFTKLTPRSAPTGSIATDVDDGGRVLGWVFLRSGHQHFAPTRTGRTSRRQGCPSLGPPPLGGSRAAAAR